MRVWCSVLLGLWLCGVARSVEHHFVAHDYDQDGHHNHTEFHDAAVKAVGIDLTPLEGRLAFEKHDTDKNGKMALHEFTTAVAHEQLFGSTLQRMLDRILFPLGLMSCGVIWCVALYFIGRLIVVEDYSDFNTNVTIFCCGSAIFLQFAFLRNWTLVVEIAAPLALLVLGGAAFSEFLQQRERVKHE